MKTLKTGAGLSGLTEENYTENVRTLQCFSGFFSLDILQIFSYETLRIEIDPRVATPTVGGHLPLDFPQKSHFPLWESRGTKY